LKKKKFGQKENKLDFFLVQKRGQSPNWIYFITLFFLVVRYGEEAGRLEVGGRSCSFWWREIAKIRDGIGDIAGGWFAKRGVEKGGGRN